MRFLQNYVQTCYASNSRMTPGEVALAEAVSSVLSSLEACLGSVRWSIRSVIQLQAIFDQPKMIVASMRGVVQSTLTVSTDEELLSVLYDRVQQLEHGTGRLGDILREILSRVSAPWLDFVGTWMGLRGDTCSTILTRPSQSTSFVRVEERTWVDERGIERKEAEYVCLPWCRTCRTTEADHRRHWTRIGFQRLYQPKKLNLSSRLGKASIC